ncbi:GspH/FimT family pseudopilin [Burkholderia stabilis]|uniref:GspH/FimT family pseudopilin n=1 Tax=Burkholderia stabilis TaxID=95485 RepID=UPI0009F6DD45|nr:GspH/FimT family pseudopilin [Burkholderia stabilis]HDR9523474.1 GspH/FimT family pseudopilin [Burkholderia stabilis]HDR9531076.1 GspH/FimT family pseudopilin [Burkholderia stabilis]HDR9538684.1 GspH/FimT family pseudopilin [Burkholderia stabilis]HDR9546799.1 GspH/FimT family pseudopilin [Burkholderia stabilis]
MRISVRGSNGMTIAPPGKSRMLAPRRAAGFTLLEMLVVLVIVGLLVAVVTLAPSRNRRTDLAEEAQRLANLLESAGDEAQVRSMPIAWQPVGGGYRFVQRTENGAWAPMTDDLYRARRWGSAVTGVSVRYTGGGEVPSRVVLGSESIDVPVTITLWSGEVRMAVVGTGIGNFVVRRP